METRQATDRSRGRGAFNRFPQTVTARLLCCVRGANASERSQSPASERSQSPAPASNENVNLIETPVTFPEPHPKLLQMLNRLSPDDLPPAELSDRSSEALEAGIEHYLQWNSDAAKVAFPLADRGELPIPSENLRKTLSSLTRYTGLPVKLSVLPEELKRNVLQRFDTKTLGILGRLNHTLEKETKEMLIEKSVETFVEKHNLTKPRGNPSDPAFLRSAIKEYMREKPISLGVFLELRKALKVHRGVAQEGAPLFSIEAILTQPYKAAEFAALSVFFEDSTEKLQKFQAMAEGSDKVLTHMRENPAAWRRLSDDQISFTNHVLHDDNRCETFVKNNLSAWLGLDILLQMIYTRNALEVNAKFVEDNTEAWFGLDNYQMHRTNKILREGGAALLENNAAMWLQLPEGKMALINDMLNAGGKTLLEDNPAMCFELPEGKMNRTRSMLYYGGAALLENNAAMWLQLPEGKMALINDMLHAGGAALLENNPAMCFELPEGKMALINDILNAGGATLLEDNPAMWLQLPEGKMIRTKNALEAGGNAAAFVRNNPEAWLRLDSGRMLDIIRMLNDGGTPAPRRRSF